MDKQSFVSEILQVLFILVKSLLNYVIVGFGAIVTFIFYITGGENKMMSCLLILMTIDYITGILKGFIKEDLNSKIGFKGFLKKIVMILLIVLAYQIDILLGNHMGLKTITLGILISNEGLLILENASMCGVPIPSKLKKALEQCKEKESD